MPRIPTYSGSQVQTQGIQVPRASMDLPLEAFGGGKVSERLEDANQRLISGVQKIIIEEKRNADDVATQEAYSKLVNTKNDLMYNPQSGAMTKKGKNAFGVVDEYGTLYNKAADELEDGLANEDQKQMFRNMRLKVGTDLHGDLDRHTFQEAQVFEKGVFESGLKSAQDDAVLNYQNPGKVADSLNTQRSLIASFAERNGLDEGQTTQAIKESTSKTHTAVIERIANTRGSYKMANAYFAEVKNQLTGKDLESVSKVLKEGTLRGQSQDLVEEALSKTQTHQEALQYVRTKSGDDVDLLDESTNRLKNMYASEKTLKEADQEKTFEDVSNVVEQSKSRDSIPINTWLSLTDGQRKAVDTRIKQLREGIEPETDFDRYYALKTLAAAAPNDFIKLDLKLERTKFNNSDYKEMVNLQASLRKGDGEADKALRGFQSDQDIVNSTLKDMGLNPNPKEGSDEATRVNMFRRAVDQQVLLLKQRNGGKSLTTEETQGIVDRLGTEVIKDRGWLWDSKSRFFEITPDQEIDLDIDQVPRGERLKIEEALKRNGLPSSEENILQLYQKRLQGQRGGR